MKWMIRLVQLIVRLFCLMLLRKMQFCTSEDAARGETKRENTNAPGRSRTHNFSTLRYISIYLCAITTACGLGCRKYSLPYIIFFPWTWAKLRYKKVWAQLAMAKLAFFFFTFSSRERTDAWIFNSVNCCLHVNAFLLIFNYCLPSLSPLSFFSESWHSRKPFRDHSTSMQLLNCF